MTTIKSCIDMYLDPTTVLRQEVIDRLTEVLGHVKLEELTDERLLNQLPSILEDVAGGKDNLRAILCEFRSFLHDMRGVTCTTGAYAPVVPEAMSIASGRFTTDELDLLADVFSDLHVAKQLVRETGVNPGRIPANMPNSYMFWQEIARMLNNGVVGGNPEAVILKAALVRFPNNSKLHDALCARGIS